MPVDAHRALTNPDCGGYLGALTLAEPEVKELRGARDDAREAIREAFRDWRRYVPAGRLFEAFAAQAPPEALRPKFRMQGSFSYKTLNDPAWHPPQEIDLDDGVFLPVSFLSQGGEVRPAVASRGYFLAVEAALEQLCAREGWELDRSKDSCVRVRLSARAHLDLALYAIPDRDFVQLSESVNARVRDAARAMVATEAVEFAEDAYRELPIDHMVLAHRAEGWKPSDPRKLDDWVQGALDRHGPQFRRLCRYLKGWRDHQWEASRLASIALMAAVDEALTATGAAPRQDRDDLALLAVAERLPDILEKPIANPVVEGARLDEGWSREEREVFVGGARSLLARLRGAIEGTDDARAGLRELRLAFGERVPSDPRLLIPDEPGLATPHVLRAGLLASAGTDPAVRAAVDPRGGGRFGGN